MKEVCCIKYNEMPDKKVIELIALEFERMGYAIIATNDTKNTQGADMHVQKANLVLRVEIKKARTKQNRSEIPPVEEARKNDDLIAVVFPSGYVLIEPMKQHLLCVGEYGSRSFYGMF